jgi:hypothetical protein
MNVLTSRNMWLKPDGGFRSLPVPSVPVYSASSWRRCKSTSWFERSADCGFLILDVSGMQVPRKS